MRYLESLPKEHCYNRISETNTNLSDFSASRKWPPMIASAQCIVANIGSLKRSLDSEDGFRSGCRNVRRQHTQDSWVQNLFLNAFSHYFGYAENNANCLT